MRYILLRWNRLQEIDSKDDRAFICRRAHSLFSRIRISHTPEDNNVNEMQHTLRKGDID